MMNPEFPVVQRSERALLSNLTQAISTNSEHNTRGIDALILGQKMGCCGHGNQSRLEYVTKMAT